MLSGVHRRAGDSLMPIAVKCSRAVRLSVAGAAWLGASVVGMQPVLGQAPGASASSVRLDGSVTVDLARGGLAGNVCLVDPPMRGDTVQFALHHGFNVKRVRNESGRTLPLVGDALRAPGDVSLLYSVRDTSGQNSRNGSSARPGVVHSICVEYVGAFPVYHVADGDYRWADGSDVIAFNGRTMRARGETRWLPTPFDAASDALRGDLPYRVDVRCADCRKLYLNGAPPHAGPEAELRSTSGVEPFILVGDFPVSEAGGMRILGETVTSDTARLFSERMQDITGFYAESLDVPFGAPPDIVRIIPVRFDRRGQFWGFFANPALGLAGLTLGDFVQILGDSLSPARAPVLGVLAHELGHRYFASMLDTDDAYYQFFSEPFAVYLDLQATRRFLGDSAFKARVRELHRRVADGPELAPPNRADPTTMASDRYRYAYAPLLLVALEQQIGARQMWHVLHELLQTGAKPGANIDFDDFRAAVRRSGAPATAVKRWEDNCLGTNATRKSCFAAIP